MASLSDLGWVYLALLALFALIFVAVVVALARQLRSAGASAPPPPAPAKAGTLQEAMAVPGARADPYLSRYVVNEHDEQVGETISVGDTDAILKREALFFVVPLEAIRIDGERLVAQDVDWETARERGEAWRAEQAAQHQALQFDEAGADAGADAGTDAGADREGRA